MLNYNLISGGYHGVVTHEEMCHKFTTAHVAVALFTILEGSEEGHRTFKNKREGEGHKTFERPTTTHENLNR